MPTIKLIADFTWEDRVKIITDPENVTFGTITELKCSASEVQYLVASGIDEKYCYASELELITRVSKKDENKNKGS